MDSGWKLGELADDEALRYGMSFGKLSVEQCCPKAVIRFFETLRAARAEEGA